ncbi:MAG: phospho-sugar mutase [Fulvivirga sp.]|uniref:phospho-sugar mutase n=1 Tax=Fulvivirga sp. TaxID=1931237 RepID=UPI0032F020FD
MSRDIRAIAEKWLNSNIEESEKEEIKALLKDKDALAEAFYKDLEFGTGGLRGIMGIGSNRMNKYTLGMATQGLANYLIKSFPNEEIKVAIAHDSRNNSRFFAENTAAVFSANGIKVFLFEDLRPTPELSFAIKHLSCHSGVVITASHNPKEYNGYKAYWNDGAQLIEPHDKNVIAEVNAIKSIDEVKFESNPKLIETIGEEIDAIYLGKVKSQCLSPDSIKNQHDLNIIYSPIHGTGYKMVPRCLKELGFTNVHLLEEQSTPDGNFPTVVYPNPEEKEALNLAIKKAKEINAELIMATDPDSDRVGIAIKDNKGEYILLNGNQTGSLLTYYTLNRWQELKKFKGNECVIKTIVTTDLIRDIAEYYGVTCYDTLTGFKYIAALIKQLEGKEKFIIGGEESYGYMVGDFVRDKDAIASCAMIAEMCAYASDHGQSLYEMLIEMYSKFGFYKERLISITKKGMKGEEEIKNMMSNFRENPPLSFAGSNVEKVTDYQKGTAYMIKTNKTESIDYPKSNVLQFYTANGYKVSMRPSGTEPKIKFYLSANTKLAKVADYEKVSKEVDALLDKIEQELNLN